MASKLEAELRLEDYNKGYRAACRSILSALKKRQRTALHLEAKFLLHDLEELVKDLHKRTTRP